MNAQIIFSDAPYLNKHSLKISYPYIEKRVFYRPESSFGLSPFFFYRRPYLCNRYSHNVDTWQACVLGQISLQSKLGTVYYLHVHFTDRKVVKLAIFST